MSGRLLPPRLHGAIVRALILRATLVWMGVRFGGSYLGVTGVSLPTSLWIAGAVILALLADARVRHEELLLANLGHSRWSVVLVAGLWVGGLEVGLDAVLGHIL